ncbi:hypothetical protein [Dipodfec virus UOA04_Rod_611]|nr:hypothetical protein [Dipodfec virus UOA04_Rod_611]
MFSNLRRYPTPDISSSSSPPVDQNLAISPSEICALTERGIASSSSNLGLSFTEGSSDPVLQIEQVRGTDVADVWNASRDASANLARAHKKDKDYYG